MGRSYYGSVSSLSGTIPESIPEVKDDSNVRVILSGAEPLLSQLPVKESLSVQTAAGAGYKMLCVILGLSDVYLSSVPSTFFYDTCAPHAILRSLNGVGLLNWKRTIENKVNILENDGDKTEILSGLQVLYRPKFNEDGSSNDFCNTDGIIAYRSQAKLLQFLKYL